MWPVLKEIKEVFDDFKARPRTEDVPPCETNPFVIYRHHHWYHSYLFPEVLLVAEDFFNERIETGRQRQPQDYTPLTIYDWKSNLTGELMIYPCNVCSEEQVLRIMAEHGLL